MNAGDQMKIEVGLPENFINKVQIGDRTEISLAAIEDEQFTGNVIEISPVVGESSTYPVSIEILDATSSIKPGMAAGVTFRTEQNPQKSSSTLTIPIKAVGEDGDGNFVFVIESTDGQTGYVVKQAIEIGAIINGGFEVRAGLSEGQLIATAGLQTLLNGQKVRLQ